MDYFMKIPCKHCPFRTDVKPFLHPDRASEIAHAVSNPYNTFPCHKTTEADEESNECYATEDSLECAGFLTLRAQEGEDVPKGFVPAWEICYSSIYEMIDSYEEQWTKTRKKIKK